MAKQNGETMRILLASCNSDRRTLLEMLTEMYFSPFWFGLEKERKGLC